MSPKTKDNENVITIKKTLASISLSAVELQVLALRISL